ncbi:hypothetical protein HanIR_Chr03g0115281 [Helianthus annuus]|nr:hypothetical protein HanIR_Chr03g0115281 [Helianthus annuus]
MYLCRLACPSVKSDVACYNVCFLGWGFVSLRPRGVEGLESWALFTTRQRASEKWRGGK